MQNSQKKITPEAVESMLERYSLNSILDYKNAVKEIVQEIALLGLWRAKFFEKAGFYGGTALRILYQLDRFSEDLDFSLLTPDPEFDLKNYEKAVQDELWSFGFEASVQKKVKSTLSAVDSAFIKLNTVQHLLLIGLPDKISKRMHQDEVMTVRLEIDTDPPEDGASAESRYLLLPVPFSVKSFRIEDLFAGKAHAALAREWKGRVKGRDWYDLVWFISRKTPLNLHYLEQRLRQSGNWTSKKKLTHGNMLELFQQRIDSLDVDSAKEDVVNFIKDTSRMDVWSKDFFHQIIKEIRTK